MILVQEYLYATLPCVGAIFKFSTVVGRKAPAGSNQPDPPASRESRVLFGALSQFHQHSFRKFRNLFALSPVTSRPVETFTTRNLCNQKNDVCGWSSSMPQYKDVLERRWGEGIPSNQFSCSSKQQNGRFSGCTSRDLHVPRRRRDRWRCGSREATRGRLARSFRPSERRSSLPL